MNEKKQDVDENSRKPEYSEAAKRILHVLWEERNDREKRGEYAKSSAKEDVLQEIWSRIVEETLDREKDPLLCITLPLDITWVDGTIYEVCYRYEQVADLFQKMYPVLSQIGHQIASKMADEYKEAVSFCRYEMMSVHGRQRLGLMVLGEEENNSGSWSNM